MIKIVDLGKTIAKFDLFEGPKAFDWITQNGLYIEHKIPVDRDVIWVVRKLP